MGVLFTIQPGWHIYAKESGDSGRPTRIEWRQGTGLNYGPVQWPAAKTYIERGGLKTYGYEKEVLLFSPLLGPPATPEAVAAARVEWLACQTLCLPGEAQLQGRLPQIAVGPILFQEHAKRIHPPSAAGSFSSMFYYLWLALLGGLILNLMPCVLPVLSLKIFSILEQGGKSRSALRREGLAYAAGIAVSFLALALLLLTLKKAGLAVGWGFQFQDARFVGAMFILVFFFGLNLLGLFEIPFGWGGAGISREGWLEPFSNGILATLLATPCSAPFLGVALGFALTRSASETVLIFQIIGLGLSLPFLLISNWPGAARCLPRPGPWMEHLKGWLGFLLLGTALWLLYLLTRLGLGVAWLPFLILAWLLAIAAWHQGQLQRTGRSLQTRRWQLVLKILLLLLAAYYLPLFPSPGLPPPAKTEERIGWHPFRPQEIERATASGQAVFVDFTAAWCLTCQANELTVLNTAATARLFRQYQVLAMRADYTSRDPSLFRYLREYGRAGVPMYLLFPPPSGSRGILLPELLTQSRLEKELRQALPR